MLVDLKTAGIAWKCRGRGRFGGASTGWAVLAGILSFPLGWCWFNTSARADPLFQDGLLDVGSLSASGAIGDLDGDGRPDLAVANYDSNMVSGLVGNDVGTFGTNSGFGTGFGTSSAVQAGSCTLCWRNRPIERCRAMVLTNFGGYLQWSTIPGGEPLRVVADWGVLVNVGARNAVGASLFVSFDSGDGVILGPAVRYRRWLSPTQSIDLALGTPVYTSDYEAELSAYGLIKYNPTHWVGLAVRPELRRQTSSDFDNGNSSTRSSFVISAGVEFGWIPGLAMTVASGALGLLALANVLAEGN